MAVWDTVRDALERFEAASVVDILTISALIYLLLGGRGAEAGTPET